MVIRTTQQGITLLRVRHGQPDPTRTGAARPNYSSSIVYAFFNDIKYVSCEFEQLSGQYLALQAAWYFRRAFLHVHAHVYLT